MGSTRPTLGSELLIKNTNKPYLGSHDTWWLTKCPLIYAFLTLDPHDT